jgi:ABC-type ATPase with predicted acetyltransferase domain
MRVAKKFGELVRSAGITAVIVTHRKEVIEAMGVDKVIYVGYGITKVENYDRSVRL